MPFDRGDFSDGRRDYDALALHAVPKEISDLFDELLGDLNLTKKFKRLPTNKVHYSAKALLIEGDQGISLREEVENIFDPEGRYASLMKPIFDAMPDELKKLKFPGPDGFVVTPASIYRNSHAQWQRNQTCTFDHS